MNAKQNTIRKYFKMNIVDRSVAVYSYHVEKQIECGAAIKGHFKCDAHAVYHTAADFNMSVGRTSQLISIARAYLEDNSRACRILEKSKELHKCKKRRKTK